MAVHLGARVLGPYERFSLYNSPYPAHDEGCAIDLYPGTLRDGRTTAAPSPVSGTVLETKAVRAPPKPYAPTHDHLVVVECEGPPEAAGLVARILHVEPTVEPGDSVAVGDSLGRLVRAGFFAPWVDNHVHLGFREPDQDPYRASGSLRLDLAVEVHPLDWDGTGTVVETGETYAVLDSPAHPHPGESWVGVAADGGETGGGGAEAATDCGGVLDGGLPHYDGGGLLGRTAAASGRGASTDSVSLNGDLLGTTTGRTVTWGDVTVLANGEPVTGLSLFCARDADFGAKIVCPGTTFELGEPVSVRVASA